MSLENLDIAFKTIEFLSVIGGGSLVLVKIGRMTERFELIGKQQAKEIADLSRGMENVNRLLVTIAEQKGRMDRMDDRAIMQGGRLDELSRRFNDFLDRGQPNAK